jgi:hypothetical protein
MPTCKKNKAKKRTVTWIACILDRQHTHELCSPTGFDACKAPLILMHKGEEFLHGSSRLAIYSSHGRIKHAIELTPPRISAPADSPRSMVSVICNTRVRVVKFGVKRGGICPLCARRLRIQATPAARVRGREGVGFGYGLLGVPREAAVDVDGEAAGEVDRGHAQTCRQRLERQVAHRHLPALLFSFLRAWSGPEQLKLPGCGMGDSVEFSGGDDTRGPRRAIYQVRETEMGLVTDPASTAHCWADE